MSAYAFNGMSIPHDEEGNLTDIGEWTPELAELIAKGENIEMTPEHWEVVNFLRAYADPKHFCRSCHDYESVSIDCFECHVSKPDAGGEGLDSPPADNRDVATLDDYLREARP